LQRQALTGYPLVMVSDKKSTLFKLRRKPDGHELKLREYFKEKLGGGAEPIGVPTVFILFTNRCGSTYFADLLRTTGLFNRAGEPLNWENVIKRSEQHGHMTFARYLLGLRKQAVDGRLAIKASLGQFDFLRRSKLLDKLFPERHVIVCERSDKIAQAVSWLIASQTLQWTSEQQAKNGDEAVAYDFQAIRTYVVDVANIHRDTEIYLTLHGEKFRRVLYEDAVADPIGEVRRVLAFLGVPQTDPNPEELRLKQQSNGLNDSFRARFLAELAGDRRKDKATRSRRRNSAAASASQHEE
jgi:LPS sulfotransferase NodH